VPGLERQGAAAAAAILWTSRGDAVIRVANWLGRARESAALRGPRCDAPGYPSTVTISPYGGGFGL
jgi:hypothetical protein